MEFEESLTNARWKILEALGKAERAASDIAAEEKLGLANVTQQLKLLEAYGFIKRSDATPPKQPGKPKRTYRLAQERGFIATIAAGGVMKHAFTLDEHHAVVLALLSYEKNDDHYFLEKYLLTTEELVLTCTAIAIIDSTQKEIHLLVLATPETLDDLRKRFSKTVIKNVEGREKNIVTWIHSEEEFREGLRRKDAYYARMLAKPHLLLDRAGVLRKLLTESEQKRREKE